MKVGIVTVYNSENCGSFLQAYAMAQYLTKQGHLVSFLKRPVSGSSHSLKAVLTECVKCILRRNFKQIKLILERHKAFSRTQKLLTVGGTDAELFVLGSDTIWNFQDRYFQKNSDLYTGKRLAEKPYIFYAASCGNTTAQDVQRLGVDLAAIGTARAVGVRDESSRELVQSVCKQEITRVVDPTLLLSRELYCAIAGETLCNGHILIYCFERLTPEQEKSIREFADSQNRKVVSVGQYRRWCDYSVEASPENFLAYYEKAHCVITNTFHGTIFSTVFEKPFCVVTKKKEKIRDYLQTVGLQDRMTEDPREIPDMLTNGPDYRQVNERIGQLREESQQFLEENIR